MKIKGICNQCKHINLVFLDPDEEQGYAVHVKSNTVSTHTKIIPSSCHHCKTVLKGSIYWKCREIEIERKEVPEFCVVGKAYHFLGSYFMNYNKADSAQQVTTT